MIRTFETRLDLRAEETLPLANVLDQYSLVMNHAQRVIHAKLKAGREWKGDLHKSLYKDLGLGSVHLNMAYRQLLAKLNSIKELAKDRVSDLKARIKSKEGEIKKRESAIGKNKVNTIKALSDVKLWKERCVRFKSAADKGHADAEKKLKRSIQEYYAARDGAQKLKDHINPSNVRCIRISVV